MTENLEQVYNDTNNQSREFFVKQYHYFRNVMCSTKYDLERKEKEFQNLAEAYFRCNLTQGDIEMFKAVALEFEKRCMYDLIGVVS